MRRGLKLEVFHGEGLIRRDVEPDSPMRRGLKLVHDALASPDSHSLNRIPR